MHCTRLADQVVLKRGGVQADGGVDYVGRHRVACMTGPSLSVAAEAECTAAEVLTAEIEFARGAHHPLLHVPNQRQTWCNSHLLQRQFFSRLRTRTREGLADVGGGDVRREQAEACEEQDGLCPARGIEDYT